MLARLSGIHDNPWEEDDPKTPKKDETGWVPGSVNSMCDYVYLADGMGNVRGLVDSNGNVSIQTFDSFGNAQGTSKLSPDQTYVDFRCNNDCDFGDPKGYKNARPPEPVERIQKGSFAWRGGEGSQTDRNARNIQYHESTEPLVHNAYTRPSTGLVYMQARYYDPQIGRFTQLDPVRYGPETFATGQNNRWTYCANDPVNASDPSGAVASALPAWVVGTVIGIAFSIGFSFGFGLGSSWANPNATYWQTRVMDVASGLLGGALGIVIGFVASMFILFTGLQLLAFAAIALVLALLFGLLLGLFIGWATKKECTAPLPSGRLVY